MSTVKSSARSEQSKQSPINLASLSREDAIERARAAGRGILVDSTAVSAVFQSLWTDWMNANVPFACGQSEEEFGDLVNSMMGEFETGVNEFIRFAPDDRALERVDEFADCAAAQAWKIHNVLAFMAMALPDDSKTTSPIRCTVADLRADAEELATSMMDLVWRARHE